MSHHNPKQTDVVFHVGAHCVHSEQKMTPTVYPARLWPLLINLPQSPSDSVTDF